MRNDITAQDLLPKLLPFQTELENALTTITCSIKQMCEDKPWARLVLDGVDTHPGAWLPYDNTDRILTGEEILAELYDHNPSLQNVAFKEDPRRLCAPDTLRTKSHSSIVLTLESEEDHRRLLNQRTLLGWGHIIRVKDYQDAKPLRQCQKCWNLDHSTALCKASYRCKRCGGNHHERDHRCDACKNTNEDCTHSKCPNCGRDHPADSKHCPVRRAFKGIYSRPRPSTAQPTPPHATQPTLSGVITPDCPPTPENLNPDSSPITTGRFDIRLIRSQREPFTLTQITNAMDALPNADEFKQLVKDGRSPRYITESIQHLLPVHDRKITHAQSLLPKRERNNWHKIAMKLISELLKECETDSEDENMITDL
jgi:hypothetical protein